MSVDPYFIYSEGEKNGKINVVVNVPMKTQEEDETGREKLWEVKQFK